MKRPLQFRLEAAAARAALALVRALPPVAASNLFGAIARRIGPMLPVSRVAEANLRLALPDLDAGQRRCVVRGVWDNLGRVTAELPHLDWLSATAAGPGWEVAGQEILDQIIAAGGPAIFFSGHLANWELLSTIPNRSGLPLASFYRAAANPLVDAIIQGWRQRAAGHAVVQFAKGAPGARGALAHLRAGGFLGMLVDQKMNDGIAVPLFGRPAMTAPAAAAFALRYRCPLVPGHIERLGPCRFRLVVEPPLALPNSGDRLADVAALTATMNGCLERWIRQHPEHWLWLHRRWPKEFYS